MQLAYQFEPNRIFAEDSAGTLLAEIQIPTTEAGLINFASVFVDPSLRGQGIADQMVRVGIAEVKKRGVKAIATCPYVVAWFEKHPEEAGVLIGEGAGASKKA